MPCTGLAMWPDEENLQQAAAKSAVSLSNGLLDKCPGELCSNLLHKWEWSVAIVKAAPRG